MSKKIKSWFFEVNDLVIFDNMNMVHDFIPCDQKVVKTHHKQFAIITGQETYTEFGNKDYEYYNIKFGDGSLLEAISGYHLTKVILL